MKINGFLQGNETLLKLLVSDKKEIEEQASIFKEAIKSENVWLLLIVHRGLLKISNDIGYNYTSKYPHFFMAHGTINLGREGFKNGLRGKVFKTRC